jgi:hypothetical protein
MNILYEIERKLPSIKKTITSKPLSISKVAKRELDFWKGKKETSSGAFDRLKKYWDNTDLRSWTPSGTPWSAAFISYILKDQKFRGQASHYKYTTDVIEGKNPGWSAFSIPKNKSKLKVQVGDVLVKPRTGGKYNTHGDVVVKVIPGLAYMMGGNLGNTAKITSPIKLNPNGTIRDAGNYLVLLKKNPVHKVDYGWSRILAFGGFAVAGILTATLGFMVVKRKNNTQAIAELPKQQDQ